LAIITGVQFCVEDR